MEVKVDRAKEGCPKELEGAASIKWIGEYQQNISLKDNWEQSNSWTDSLGLQSKEEFSFEIGSVVNWDTGVLLEYAFKVTTRAGITAITKDKKLESHRAELQCQPQYILAHSNCFRKYSTHSHSIQNYTVEPGPGNTFFAKMGHFCICLKMAS